VRRPLPCRRDEDGESIPSGDEESGDSDDDDSMSSAETDTERGVVTEMMKTPIFLVVMKTPISFDHVLTTKTENRESIYNNVT
jgi:hypothetical protein